MNAVNVIKAKVIHLVFALLVNFITVVNVRLLTVHLGMLTQQQMHLVILRGVKHAQQEHIPRVKMQLHALLAV